MPKCVGLQYSKQITLTVGALDTLIWKEEEKESFSAIKGNEYKLGISLALQFIIPESLILVM